MRHVQDVTRFCSKPRGDGRRDRLASLGDVGHEHPRAQLDVLESVARRLLDPPQLFGSGCCEPALSNAAADSPIAQVEVHIYDVGLTGGKCQHATTPAANQDRWMRLLNRQRVALELSDPVVLAGEREAAAGDKTLDDLQPFFHSLDADTRAVVRDSRLLVVLGQPARPQAEIKPAVGKEVHRRDLLGQHDRMAVIVVEYQGADSQGGSRVCSPHQGGDRCKLLAEVVGKVEELITERLHKPRSVPPRLAAGCGVFLHPKPEWLGRVFHDYASSQPAASALSMISAGCAPETP